MMLGWELSSDPMELDRLPTLPTRRGSTVRMLLAGVLLWDTMN